MAKKFFAFVLTVFTLIMLLPLVTDFQEKTELNSLAKDYVKGSINDLNTQNVVTSIVVTYRGLDTLGEVTVLFLATAGVGFLLKKKRKDMMNRRESSEILKTGTKFLVPLIILFGVYIFVHGHLTPGGGFQGGVLIASAFLLMMLAEVNTKINHNVLNVVESLSGAFYVTVGIFGLVLIGGFLAPSFIPLGKFGTLFSGGSIPVIYSLIGLKVGSELTGILESMGGSE